MVVIPSKLLAVTCFARSAVLGFVRIVRLVLFCEQRWQQNCLLNRYRCWLIAVRVTFIACVTGSKKRQFLQPASVFVVSIPTTRSEIS